MNFSRLKRRAWAFICLAGIISIFSCEVGLGAAVDVEAPTSAISYPPKNAIVRDTFVAAGECKDDMQVESVKVTVFDPENNKTYGPYDATLGADGTTWSVSLNQKDASKATSVFNDYKQWEFPDGNYIISAVAYDKDGKSSPAASSPISIDNTAPVLVVSKPIAVGDDDPTIYGSYLKLTGDISEDHETAKLILNYKNYNNTSGNFTDTEVRTVVVEDSALLNAMSSSNPLVIAKYEGQDGDSDQHNNYIDIYGTVPTTNLQEKIYYGGFQLEDNAKVYNTPGDSGSGPGNQTTQYYLLSEDLAVNYSLTAPRIKEILKGTSTAYSATQISQITASLSTEGFYASSNAFSGDVTDTQVKAVSSKFSLNPHNNPTWALEECGISSSTAGIDNAVHSYTAGSSLILTLEAGRDASYPNPRSVTAHLYDMGAYDVNVDYNSAPLPTDPDKHKLLIGENGIVINRWDESADDSIKTFTFSLDPQTHSLTSNNVYRLEIHGQDRNEVDLEPLLDCKYLFRLSTSNNIPRVTIESPEDDNTFGVAATAGNVNTDGVTISGYVETDGVSLKSISNNGLRVSNVTVTDISNSQIVQTLSNYDINDLECPGPGSSGNRYTFSFKLQANSESSFVPSAQSKYLYVVTVQAEDIMSLTGEKNIKFNVDNKEPEVSINTVTPNVSVNSLSTVFEANGNIVIKGTASDSGNTGSGLKSLEYTILNGTTPVVPYTSLYAASVTPPETWSFNLATKDLTDNINYTVKVRATDTKDNKKESSPITLHVNQSTDTPVVSFSNANSNTALSDLNASTNMFGTENNNKLYGTITDDDAIGFVNDEAAVKVSYLKEGSAAGTQPTVMTSATTISSGSNSSGPKSANFEYTLPDEEGEYKISVEVKDKFAVTSNRETDKDIYTKDFYITIDNGAPEFSSVTPNLTSSDYVLGNKDGAAETQYLNVHGTIRDGNGFSSTNPLTVKHYKKNASGNWVEDTSTTKPVSVNPETDAAITSLAISAANEFSDKIKLASATGTYKAEYTAKDKYNQSSTYEIEYSVDVTAPQLYKINVGSNEISGETASPSINTYIKDNHVNVAVFVKDTDSGISSVKYSLDNGATYSPMTMTNLEAADLTEITDTQLRASYEKWIAGVQFIDGNSKTLKLKIEDDVRDETKNKTEKIINIKVDRSKPVLDVKWYQIADENSATSYFTPSGETAYVNDKNLVIYANYTDTNEEYGSDNSGITAPVFKIGSNITPTITYYKEKFTTKETASTVMTEANTLAYNENNAKLIKSFKAVIPNSQFATGDLIVSGSDIAGNQIENNNRTIISLAYDTVSPVISVPNIPNAYKAANGLYYVRRVNGQNLTVSGTSTDDVVIDKTVITITGQGTDSYTAESTATAWSFDDINLNAWTKNENPQTQDESINATINITTYDKAGNTTSITPVSLVFDEVKPAVLTGIPAGYTSEDFPDASDEGDRSNPFDSNYTLRGKKAWKYGGILIGSGKYGDTTYGRESSIELEITYIKEQYGSGVAKIEYKMLASSAAESLKNTKTGKYTGALPSVTWTKSGEFDVSASTYTHYGNPTTYPCYKGRATISGFENTTNGNPNLLFVKATDNCGNESDWFVLLIQMDSESPDIVSDSANPISLLTNGKSTLQPLKGSISEKFYSSGLKAIRLYIDGKLAIDGNFTKAPATGLTVAAKDKDGNDLTGWLTDSSVYNKGVEVSFTNDYGTLKYKSYAPTEAELNSVLFTPGTSTTKCSLMDAASYVTWELELTPQNGTWFNDIVGKTSPQITIEAEDWADDSAGSGNKATNIVSSFDIDVTKPTAVLLNPVGNSEGSLNGEHLISGSVTENHTVKSVSVYYSTEATPPASLNDWTRERTLTTESAPSVPDEKTDYAKSLQELYSFKLTDKLNFNNLIGAAESAPVHVLVYVEDKAGNTNVLNTAVNQTQRDGTYAYKSFTVDRNSDRPVVTVTSANIVIVNSEGETSPISATNPLPLDTRTVNLSVSDDDGVDTVEYRITKLGATPAEDVTGAWTSLTLANGGAFVKFNNDGIHKLEFRVKDKANSNWFTSSETDPFRKIYLTDTAATPHKYGTTVANYTDPTLYVKIDTEVPALEVKGVQLLSTADEAQASWITEGYSNLVVGGPSTSFMRVKVEASDEGTGIKNVKISAKLDGDSVSPIAASTATVPVSDSIYEVIIPCTISDVEKENVNFVVTLTAEDNAGKQRSQAITFKADTKLPVITVTSPLSTTHLSGSISAEGQISESATVYYAISPIEDSPDTYATLSASAWNYIKYDSSDNEITPAINLPTTDKAGVEITPSQPLATLCAYQQMDESKMLSFYMWFDGKTDGSSSGIHSETLNTWIKNMGITTSKDLTSPSNPFDDMIKLYLHIKAIDSAGNKRELHYPLMLDPLGSRPTVTIGYPSYEQAGGSNELTLGGAPTIIGTATGTNVVDYVWLQVDCNADGAWTEADFNTLLNLKDDSNNAIYSLGRMDTKQLVTGFEADSSIDEYAIRIEPTGLNWVQQINIKKELNPAADSGVSTKAVKIWAYSTDRLGFISSQEKRNLIIDSESPVIDQDIKLVQWNDGKNGGNGFAVDSDGIQFNADGSIKFAEGAVKAVQSYNDNENIKGKWFVIGKVSDSSGIKSVSYKVNGGSLVNAITDSDASYTGTGANAGTYIRRITGNNYVFCLPIGNDTENTVGEYSIEFSAEEIGDSNPKSAERTFSVRYDNKAPAIDTLLSGYTSGTLTIANSNGVYTFGGIASEDKVGTVEQTGIERIAFYFTRNITGHATKIYDPMIRTGCDGNETNYSGLSTEDGLYWHSLTVNTSGGTITVSDATALKNIHKGGLVKVNGVIHTITGVVGSAVSVDDNLGVQTGINAKFAIANIIDNPTRESEGEIKVYDDYGYGYTRSTSSFDDGDYMVESLVQEGTKYTWEANINSRNISDGPVTLHYVVFDKAGNTTTEQTIECFIKNNQPRLAGVMLGTDEDGNGNVEGTEFITSYQNAYAQGYNGKNKVDSLTVPGNSTAASPKSIFKIKGKTVIRPEIVGGNGTVGYTYKVAKRNAANTGWDEAVADLVYNSGSTPVYLGAGTEDNDESQVYISDNGGIIITVKDFLQNHINDGENQKFTFTIWDSTPGLTYGTDSQSATLNVIMDVALNDETSAMNKIIPFYWKSSIENSLKDNDPAMGHIELSKDLPAAFTSTGTGIYSLNPKISGAVMLEGIAKDNTLLSELKVTIDGTERTIATYSTEVNPSEPWTPGSGTGWSSAVRQATYEELFNAGYITDIPGDVEETAAVPYTSQDYGHVVHWSMLIDTEVMGINPKAGIEISVSALDKGKPTLIGTGDAATVTYESNSFKFNGGADATLAAVLQTGGDRGDGPQTCKYNVDVVPYIRGVKTYLSGKSSKDDTSEYDRTALGHYPIANTEEIYLYGFNLADCTLYDSKTPTPNTVALGAADASSFADQELTVYKTAGALTNFISGKVSVKYVTDEYEIESINNLNDNDAQGDYGADLPETETYGDEDTYETFSNFYNRMPNTSNNYILTDDVELDVWKFNSDAARSSPSGRIDEVSMKINPASDSQIIGFSFLSGSMHFSTPKGKANSYKNTGGTGATGDFRTTSFLAYDWRGWSYALDAGGNEGDRVKFWIVNTNGDESGSVNIEIVNQTGSRKENGGSNIDLRYKVRSPSIVTSRGYNADGTANDTTNMYMAYYDSFNDEIRYKCGNTDSMGLFVTRARAQYTSKTCQVIATDTDPSTYPTGANYQYTGTPLGGAGEFVAIDVIPKGTIVDGSALAKDVVVIVWYDVKAKALKYSYNEDPLNYQCWQSGTTGTNTAGTRTKNEHYRGLNRYNWEDASTIFDGAGEFCQIKVDGKGGVHIAAYDSVYGDLRYAYLPTYKSGYSEDTMSYTVDSTGNTGAYLILDVALDEAGADGKGVPYISYWGGNMPKIAYMSSSAPGEGTYNDMFSGNWEVSYIPTTSSISDLDKKRLNNLDNRINIALWKDSDGVIKASTTGTSSAGAETGTCYGNGTANPVVGYTIVKDSANDRIETAQMQ